MNVNDSATGGNREKLADSGFKVVTG